jgi:2-polyprenyl-6-methoxyphenol hydroxylase-like FAD-dependent oxidoreductase
MTRPSDTNEGGRRVTAISTKVLIVGAGPVGLTTAIALRQNGIDVVVLEKRTARESTASRAMVVHARTLEVLEVLEVTEALVASGHRASSLTFRDGAKTLLRLPFDDLPTKYPYMLMVPQWRTEQILEERFAALGERIRYGWTFTGLQQHADGVDVDVQDTDGEHHLIRALLVVGADGVKSAVRQAAGIPFVGDDYQGDFLLADVEMTSDLSDGELHTFLAPEGMMVINTLPNGIQRIMTTDVPIAAEPTRDELERLVHVRATNSARIASVGWTSRYRVSHRIAARYRRDRVLLAGDAAHLHSPAGGQGMSTGIQDGVVLAEYERRRRRVAENVIRLTDRFTRLVTVRNAINRRLRNTALSALGVIPALERMIALRMSELADTTAPSAVPTATSR